MLITGNRLAHLYTNDGLGNFTLVAGTPFVGVDFSSIAFADVDKDGDQDVLITGQSAQYTYLTQLYTNNGSGVFTLVAGTPFVGVAYSSIGFADVDKDGDQDVLITGAASPFTPLTQLYTNNGSGVFTLVAGTPFQGVYTSAIGFADVDKDGDQDVLITGRGQQPALAQLYTNNGSGVFTLVNNTPFAQVNNGSIEFADVDQDGDQDVLITGQSSGQSLTQLYRNLTVQPPCTVSVFTNLTPDGLAVQVTGGARYERLKSVEQINGYQIRQTEQNGTGYFLIRESGPYAITITGANGCQATVTGTR